MSGGFIQEVLTTFNQLSVTSAFDKLRELEGEADGRPTAEARLT